MNEIFYEKYFEIYVFVFVIFLFGIILKVINFNVYCCYCKIVVRFKI